MQRPDVSEAVEMKTVYRFKQPYRAVHKDADQVLIWGGLWSGPGFILQDSHRQGFMSPVLSQINGANTLEKVLGSIDEVLRQKGLQLCRLPRSEGNSGGG